MVMVIHAMVSAQVEARSTCVVNGFRNGKINVFVGINNLPSFKVCHAVCNCDRILENHPYGCIWHLKQLFIEYQILLCNCATRWL